MAPPRREGKEELTPAVSALSFEWVDVFTDRPYAGNPLAVFSEPGDLSAEEMQAIARELNLSETTFVQPSRIPEADFRVRIFTPTAELPMAGHPTLGTAFVLARQGLVAPSEEGSNIVFEEGVGPIEVLVEWEKGSPGRIVMSQPDPTFGRVLEDRRLVAELVGLEEDDLAPSLPAQVVSTGPPFLFVPLRGLEQARAAALRLDLWRDALAGTDAETVYVFALETENDWAQVHGRLFAPGFGITEDPATGSAVGPLGAYLVQHGVMEAEPLARMVIEQGLEMGRPSRLEVEIECRDNAISEVRVGGRSAAVIEGSLERLPRG